MLLSKPKLLALNAGTSSNSELTKSLSVIPYFSFNIFKIFNFTLWESFSSPKGILPTNKFKFSPGIASLNFLSDCSTAK